MEKMLKRMEGKEMKYFCFFSLVLLFAAAAAGNLAGLAKGLWLIIVSRDALITDYFELAGYGAAFLNAGLVMGISILLVVSQKIPFTGPTIAALFINAGYGLWGKNPVNILPVILGTALYARVHRSKLNRYIYTALFGTCLAPLITELVFLFPFGQPVNFLLGALAGIVIGFVLPALSMHTASMHMGYNLFNVGFSGGILAFVIVCILRAFGMESESVLIWREGQNGVIGVCLFLYFLLTVVFGFFINGKKLDGLKKLMGRSGCAVSDFVLMDGAGPVLMNMGLVGISCELYILLTGGDFSGPVIGAILAVFGFSAFGVHIKNYLPVLAGVYISTFFTMFSPETPGIQLAAVFAAGLSPIAGQFGIAAGMIAGFLHAAVVMCTGQMYGGLNLYNNGFSAGWVAVVMVPVAESFRKYWKERKKEK
ncbi:MAG TPA: DUF1576 domain-containing protein [Lachnospiraceae bacterium]|nr:DUF1576 domain-containing protein [Lachnospiraceae bacterium]